MRIFLDTNVILENFLAREDFVTAHNLFHAMQRPHDYPSDDKGSLKVMTPAEYLQEQENKSSEKE